MLKQQHKVTPLAPEGGGVRRLVAMVPPLPVEARIEGIEQNMIKWTLKQVIYIRI